MAGISLLLFAEIAGAQTYTNSGYGDLMAGFRKTGSHAEPNELVVTIGNITNLLSLTVGTTINITSYSNVQITNMCPDDLNNLQWSVFASVRSHGFPDAPWITSAGSFPPATCWYTLPRTNVNNQTTPPFRYSYPQQGSLRSAIGGVINGAVGISQSIGVSNLFNNYLLVTEPVADGNSLSTSIGDRTTPSLGDFGGTTFGYSVENTTPSTFSSAQRADLYQSCATAPGPTGVSMVDPTTGQASGQDYYVGYFTLNTDGTMTFTRDTQTVVNNPPPPVLLSIISTGTPSGGGDTQVTSTISFGTTNGATYTLYFTNSTGLTSPLTNWPSLGSLTGDGLTHSFTNSSTDMNRFYVVGGH